MARNTVDPADTGSLSTQTISSEGKAPKRRIATASAAFSAYTKFVDANMRRDQRFGDIAGIFAGFPPNPPIQNERNGQADMPNVNTKQFQAKVNTYTSTWTAINAQGDGYMEVEAIHDDPMEAERRSKVLAKGANYAITLWDCDSEEDFQSGNQHTLESSARDTQMGLFGIGLAYFRDPIDFRPRTIPTRRLLVAEGTRLTLDNCSAMFIEDSMSVTDLYGMIGKDGWNEKAILRNLYEHVELLSKSGTKSFTYSEWVNQIRNNDSWLLSEFQPVTVIHGYVKEFDQTITHFAFTNLYGTGKQSLSVARKNSKDEDFHADSDSFIYDKLKAAKKWRQVVVPFADNAGPECDWHGVKGFGDLIFDGCHNNNQMYTKACIGAVMTNLLMFMGQGENDSQKMDQLTLTQFGLMAPGLSLEQVRFQADIEGAMTVFNTGTQIMSENTRIAPQNEKTTAGDNPTATQVNADRADRAQFTTLQIAIYRAVGQDVLFGEMYRRLAQPASKYATSWSGGMVAKRFREYCKKYGIPEEDLLKIRCVKANRNVGSGDLALDILKADQLISVATPGRGQLNARKEKVAALKGVEMVGAFIEEEQAMPGQDEAQLALEQNLIQLGQIPTAFGWQDPVKHVSAHMQLLGQGAQAAAELKDMGITPQNLEGAKKLTNFLNAGIEHTKQHVALMSEVKRNGKEPALYEQFAQMATKQLHNLDQINDSLDEDIAKADQAQQPQASPEMMKAQQEMEIRAAQAQQEMEHKDMAHKAKLGNLAVTTQARTEAKVQDHQVQLALREQAAHEEDKMKTATTIVDLHRGALKSEQELSTQREKDALAVETAKKKAAQAKKPKKK